MIYGVTNTYTLNPVYIKQSGGGVYSIVDLLDGDVKEISVNLYFDVEVNSGSSISAYEIIVMR